MNRFYAVALLLVLLASAARADAVRVMSRGARGAAKVEEVKKLLAPAPMFEDDFGEPVFACQ